MARLTLKPVSNDEAARLIAGKASVERKVFDRLLPDLRARGFTVTGIESATVRQRIRDRIAELPRGASWEELRAEIVEDAIPYFVDPSKDPEKQFEQEAAAERRAELLLRVHGFQAYQAVQYQVMRETADALPYWQYLTMGDDAVRPEHAALNGLVLPADSPFWDTHYPPWDWNCRCQVVAISAADAGEIEAGGAFGRTLTADQTADLEQRGRLALGNGNAMSVLSDFQRGQEGAFHWKPGDLRIPLDDLRERYDDAVWQRFEADMRAARVDGMDKSVWDWLVQA